MNKMNKLLSNCHNAEVLGHPESPSGDPTRCTQCGEICGTHESMTPQWIEEKLKEFDEKWEHKWNWRDYPDEAQEKIKSFIQNLLTQQLEEVVRWSLNNHYDFIENEWRKYRGSKTCKELFLERYQKSLQTNV